MTLIFHLIKMTIIGIVLGAAFTFLVGLFVGEIWPKGFIIALVLTALTLRYSNIGGLFSRKK